MEERSGSSQSILRKRLRKFRSLKRGYYSFIAIAFLYLLSFLNPLFINNRALLVRYEGRYYFPVFRYYAAETFDQELFGEADYRVLTLRLSTAESGNFILMPPYPYHPIESLLEELDSEPPTPPSRRHFLGTDNRGRDVFARLVYGFNTSITFALIVTLCTYAIGVSIGAVLGYFGGRVDIFGQRFIEIFAAIPFLYTMIIIQSSLREPKFIHLVLVLTLFRWMRLTYYIRGEFYREKARDYVSAAVSMGAAHGRVMFRHILPNALTPIITFAPFAIVGSISTLVSLDFLGFGLPPPTPSWGELVNQGISDIRYWWLILSPMVATFFTLLLITFIGEGAREAFDPKVYSRLR